MADIETRSVESYDGVTGLPSDPREVPLVVVLDDAVFAGVVKALRDAGHRDLVHDYARRIITSEVHFVRQRDHKPRDEIAHAQMRRQDDWQRET